MRKLTFVALLLCFPLTLAAQTTTHKKDGKPRTTMTAVKVEPSTAEMKHLLDLWSSGDYDSVKPFYDKSPNDAFYDVLPLKYTGLEEYVEGVKKAFGEGGSVKLTMNDDAQAHRSGNMAYGAATIRADVTDKTGKTQTLAARWTVVWEKKGNQWLVVHEHTSVPMPENK